MKEEQQGLLLLTAVCSLVSLLSSCFLLLTCGITGLWKSSSVRLIIYLTICNILTGLDLLIPTYTYEFMCAFQGHVLNFGLYSQLVWGCLLVHYAHLKVVQEKKFIRMFEVRYLGIGVIPALLASLPLFVSENVGKECWAGDRTPLLDVVESYGFLVVYTIGFLVILSFSLGFASFFDLFPKGFYPDEYDSRYEKVKLVYRFAAMIYAYGFFLYIYAMLELMDLEKKSLDFIAMFLYASCGTFTLVLFLSSTKIKREMRSFFKSNTAVVDLMAEDKDNFTSFTEKISHLSD